MDDLWPNGWTVCVFRDFPASLEQLLERQWEQGSQFLMKQGEHFDSKSEIHVCLSVCLPVCLSEQGEHWIVNLWNTCLYICDLLVIFLTIEVFTRNVRNIKALVSVDFFSIIHIRIIFCTVAVVIFFYQFSRQTHVWCFRRCKYLFTIEKSYSMKPESNMIFLG